MMKRILLLIAFFAVYGVFAQTMNYKLTVRTTKGQPLARTPVVFVEKQTFERMEAVTNEYGILEMVFDKGGTWTGSVGQMYNCLEVDASRNGTSSKFMTYDLTSYEREKRILPDRRSFDFEQVPQSHRTVLPPTERETFLKVTLANNQGTRFPNVPVTLTCFALEQQFTAITNVKGEAYFMLPISNDYEIDVDDVESISWIDLKNIPMSTSVQLLYEKKNFTEKVVDDYVVQTLPAVPIATSTHSKVKLQITQGGEIVDNESVYVRMLKSGKTYKAKTNQKGEVIFMLPIRGKYMVNFTYQHDAAFVDLSGVKGLAEQTRNVVYTPDPRLQNIEQFMPKVNDLVDYDINNFLNTQYPAGPQDVDLFLKWGNKFNAQSKEALLEVGFRVNGNKKNPVVPKNLMFVVDISGSMSGDDRLELLKNNLIEFIQRSTPEDRFGLVVFDETATLAFPSQPMTNKQALIDIIRSLYPRGGTNIYNGLTLGLEELAKTKAAGRVNRLVLMTDGYCSIEPAVTIQKAKEYAALGLQISAIGIGADYNQSLLLNLATVGGGLLQMAGDPGQFQQVFLKEFYSTLEPFGKDVTLEVLYNDEIVYRQILGYQNEVVSKGSMKVAIDQLFPGLQKIALMKFDLINPTAEIEQMPVVVRLKYHDLASKTDKVVEESIYPKWTTATGQLDLTLDKQHKKALAVAIANQSIKNMANAFESGDRAGAEAAVASGVKQIKEQFPDAQPAELDALMNKLKEYVMVLEMARLGHH